MDRHQLLIELHMERRVIMLTVRAGEHVLMLPGSSLIFKLRRKHKLLHQEGTILYFKEHFLNVSLSGVVNEVGVLVY